MSAATTLPAGLPGWKHSPCLGCGDRVGEKRDAYVQIGGTRDGSVVLVMDAEPHRSFATRPEALGSDELFMLGVAHRRCIDLARTQLEAGSVSLPQQLPRLICEPYLAPLERLDLPPRDGICPFCESTKDLSDEDAIPEWISKAIRDQTGGFFTTTLYGLVKKSQFARVLARICRPCNNHWLAVMEQDTGPVLLDLIKGSVESRELSADDQRLIARWAIKTALMIDLSADVRVVPLGFYQQLRQRREPLPSMVVRIGAYCGTERAVYFARAPLFLADPKPEAPDAFVCTFAMHRLVLQVWGHFTNGNATLHDDRSNFEPAFHRIWPIVHDSVTWPRDGLAFGDQALNDFVAEATTNGDEPTASTESA